MRQLLTSLTAGAFVLALALILSWKLIPSAAAVDNFTLDSWPIGHRHLIVSDRTGDPAWHAAITQAVATWAQAGTDLRFTLVTQTGPCRQQSGMIEICKEPQKMLALPEIPGREGYVDPRVDSRHHFHSVDIIVCSDCGVDQARQAIIATHEIGHAIGLPHNGSAFSVMYPTGGPFGPDSQDLQILRSKYPVGQR